jgi:hypothetical protein
VWIVSAYHHLTGDMSPSMLKCFEVILRRLEKYSVDSYRVECASLKFRIALIKSKLKLVEDVDFVE